MEKELLIDTSQTEEIRIAVVDEKKILEEFEFELQNKKNKKANIYLGKIIRVEPALQAAFIDYGEGRNGFLPFSEIHTDYYQIPVADRQRLKELIAQEQLNDDDAIFDIEDEMDLPRADYAAVAPDNANDSDSVQKTVSDNGADAEFEVETFGGYDDNIEPQETEQEKEFNRKDFFKKYKIQEVIKKNQVVLVQVLKEERGEKGASLSTYISLIGRYCIFMPNTRNSGGISRKIVNQKDRMRLRKILQSLDMTDEMSMIVRTAGQERNKAEITRDYEFLKKLWNDIRTLTLESQAPAKIHEESDIIRRSIRDVYDKNTNAIWVEGKEGYKIAKNLMKQLIPSHAKKVKLYDDEKTSLFHAYNIDGQIINIQEPKVALPSGGYLVIDQAEALVAIDINSGKSIKGRNVEETAYQTNMEACEIITKQLRLRDLAGLIVIDFIDMQNRANITSLENKMRDCIRNDRARIQMNNLSIFGLLEISRQRLRPSVFDTIYNKCDKCSGVGIVKSIDILALNILRHIENRLTKLEEPVQNILIKLSNDTALYLFNNKRGHINTLEKRFDTTINFSNDPSLGIDKFLIYLDTKLSTQDDLVDAINQTVNYNKLKKNTRTTQTSKDKPFSNKRRRIPNKPYGERNTDKPKDKIEAKPNADGTKTLNPNRNNVKTDKAKRFNKPHRNKNNYRTDRKGQDNPNSIKRTTPVHNKQTNAPKKSWLKRLFSSG